MSTLMTQRRSRDQGLHLERVEVCAGVILWRLGGDRDERVAGADE